VSLIKGSFVCETRDRGYLALQSLLFVSVLLLKHMWTLFTNHLFCFFKFQNPLLETFQNMFGHGVRKINFLLVQHACFTSNVVLKLYSFSAIISISES
jgi:hypothetical protein